MVSLIARFQKLVYCDMFLQPPFPLLPSLAKKAKAIDKPVPIQPMDLMQEIKYTPVNQIDSELDN